MTEQFTLTINGTEYTAKRSENDVEWNIEANGQQLGAFAGYRGDRKHVENFIRYFLAK